MLQGHNVKTEGTMYITLRDKARY